MKKLLKAAMCVVLFLVAFVAYTYDVWHEATRIAHKNATQCARSCETRHEVMDLYSVPAGCVCVEPTWVCK